MVTCGICDGEYAEPVYHLHIRSLKHKKAVQMYNKSPSEHPRFGMVLRQTHDVRHTLIVFPGLEEYTRVVKKYSECNIHKTNAVGRPPPSLLPLHTTSQVRELSPANISDFINFYREGILTRITSALNLHTSLKINLFLNILLRKESPDGEILHADFGLRSHCSEIYETTNLNQWLDREIENLQTRFEEAELEGSNWVLEKIVDLELQLNRFVPLSASSYLPLPKPIANKHAIININNDDNRCFFYSVMCKFLPETLSHKEHESYYTRELMKKLEDEGKITFHGMNLDGPTSFREIDYFERRNKCSVNVYGLTRSKKYPTVYPLRISKVFEEEKHFDLLYLTNGDNSKQHYCYIKNLSRLIRSQKTSSCRSLHFCRSCFTHFYSEESLKRHHENCLKHRPVKVSMPIPKKNDFLAFTGSRLRMKEFVPYVIYADFESNLQPVEEEVRQTANTIKKTLHTPTSFSYYVVSRNPEDKRELKPFIYCGVDAVQLFWKKIKHEVKVISSILSDVKPMVISTADRERLINTPEPVCHICEKRILDPTEIVLDHDHLSSNLRQPNDPRGPCNVRGIAHRSCNLDYTIANFVPVVFQNGSKYDFRFLVSSCIDDEEVVEKKRNVRKRKQSETDFDDCGYDNDTDNEDEGENEYEEESGDEDECEDDDFQYPNPYLSDTNEDDDEYVSQSSVLQIEESDESKPRNSNVRILATSAENFISFQKPVTSKMSVRFIDSYRFLSASLASMASLLGKDKMINVRKFFPSDEEFEIASQKGVFPYEYIVDFSRYNDRELPPKESFYSELSGLHISDDEYSFARKAWTVFKCKTLGDYNEKYLLSDVLLLADIFEAFRDTSYKIYKLDPAHTYSAPSLSFNAMLKKIKKPVPLLTDYDMHLLFESAVRGGFCNVSTKHVKANNRYMGCEFDAEKAKKDGGEKYLTYFDANNLYGYALSQPLPYSDFKWKTDEKALENLRKCLPHIPDDNEYGVIIECDLHIPKTLHEKFQDFPFAPEHIALPSKKRFKVPKLMATLHDKKKYVVHYRYLKSMLKHGVEVSKIHRAIAFKQEPWMRDYITMNTELRKRAANEFEKNFFKLMVNSCYGKTLEGCRNKRNFALAYQPKLVQRRFNSPRFKSAVLLNEEKNLFLIESVNTRLVFDKPVHAGMCVLDNAKMHMSEFHYGVMRNLFPNKDELRLAYTDTDSLIYEVTTDKDFYKVLEENKEYFDFSDYPSTHPCYDTTNKKVLGKFKDEANGSILAEFVGLRSKLYSLRYHTNESKLVKKAKGVKSVIVKNHLTFSDYLTTLIDSKKKYVTQHTISSKNHIMHTVSQHKLAMSNDDDKRYLIPDQYALTLPWGHKDIPLERDLVLFASISPRKYLLNSVHD